MHNELISDDWPKVVVIGGGTGLSVLLRGLKKKNIHITAVVTVADDGGSSGVLRNEMQMPPPGDVRNVLVALADAESMLSRVLNYRFQNGTGLAGHSLGNLILAAMNDITGSFVDGIKELSQVLAVRGQVLPASEQAIVLQAEMEDGTIVTGESMIPKANKKIKRVFLEDAEQIAPLDEAIEALQQADVIIAGPGSLYTSILPNLLVPKIVDTIKQSRACKVYICNVMTQPGETDGFSVCDHLQTLEHHVGERIFSHVMVNNGNILEEVQAKYAQEGARPVLLDQDKIEANGYHIIADRLVQFQTYLRHDAERLSEHIYRLARDAKQKGGVACHLQRKPKKS